MYLFAHRVRSPRGQRGINAAKYHHPDRDTAFWSMPAPDLLTIITQKENGRRVTAQVEIAPGGNSVEAFLDLVGPDDTDVEQVGRALATARKELPRSRFISRDGLASIEFGVNLGVEDAGAVFDDLREAVVQVFTTTPARAGDPVDIEVGRTEEGWTFQVADASAERVRGAGGMPHRVSIGFDVASDFRALHGNLYPYAAQWATGLSSEQILDLGGARFLHEGRQVGRWPAQA